MGEPLSFIGQISLAGFAVSVCLVIFADDARLRRWIMALGLGCIAGIVLHAGMGLVRMGIGALVVYWYWHLFRTQGKEKSPPPEVASPGPEPAVEVAVERDAPPSVVTRMRR